MIGTGGLTTAEKEYIEREKLNDMLEDFCVNESFYDALQTIPSADVSPVRHGWWKVWDYAPKRKAIILDSAYEQYEALGYPHRIILAFQCSECNMVSMVDKNRGKYDFCPNCGARMDEKGRDEND